MSASAHRPALTALCLVAAVVGGSTMALQARVNGQLAAELDDAILAALISFGTGLIVCLIAVLLAPSGRRGLAQLRRAVVDRRMAPWYLLGGTAGAAMVSSQALTTPLVGVAAFTVALVGGQLVGAVIVDVRGVAGVARQRLTPRRWVGAIIAILAVAWSVSGSATGDLPWWLLVLPFVTGAATSWQAAANGLLRRTSGSVVSATFVSFLAGTIVLAVAAIVDLSVSGAPASFPASWWLYTGGTLGIVFVAVAAGVVSVVGALLVTLASVAGQLATAMLLDAVAPVSDAPLGAATIGAAVLAVLAVVVATVRMPGRGPVARGSRGASTP